MAIPMRIFETYPPSSLIAATTAVAVVLIGGLPLAVPFLVGVGVMVVGHRFDLYGVRRDR